MGLRPTQQELAKRSLNNLSSAVQQLINDLPQRDKDSKAPKYRFLRALASAGKRLETPSSSLHQQRFTTMEDFTTSEHFKKRLIVLAESNHPRQKSTREAFVTQLTDISRDIPSSTDTGVSSEVDWKAEMTAMYEAFSKYRLCRDKDTNTTEPLVTQIGLSEIDRHKEMGMKISVLIRIHVHTNSHEDKLVRSWRHINIDVFHQNNTALPPSQLRSPAASTYSAIGQDLGASILNSGIIRSGTLTPKEQSIPLTRGKELCRTLDGIPAQLLQLQIRNEKLYFVKKLQETTNWVLDKPSVSLSTVIGHKCIRESPELRILICSAVARAVWQLYGSGWWESSCTIDNFRFVWSSSHTSSLPDLYIDKPFFYNDMDEFRDDDGSAGLSHKAPMIFALGIILLEVELGLRIENHIDEKARGPNGAIHPDTYLLAAKDLCKNDNRWKNDKRDQDLQDIILKCVTGSCFLSSNGPEDIRQSLLHNVVERLKRLSTTKAASNNGEECRIPDACQVFGDFVVTEQQRNDPVNPLDAVTEPIVNDLNTSLPDSQNESPSSLDPVKSQPSPTLPQSDLAAQVEAELADCDGGLSTVPPTKEWDEAQRCVQLIYHFCCNMTVIHLVLRYEKAYRMKSSLQEPDMFQTLRQTWSNKLKYTDGDEHLRIAILDTGIDIGGCTADSQMHDDFRQIRAVSFQSGKPCSDKYGTPQWDRIKGRRNFCLGDEIDVQDLDGHGTAVAGIILRLAPETHLYIARICVGDVNYGRSEGDKHSVEKDQPVKPPPGNIKRAIEWAIEQQVHIINMSFGFPRENKDVEEALKLAYQNNILVFAAMSNVWPAKELQLCIGIHSCTVGGKRSSDFTPRLVDNNPNFIVPGENIPVHWPSSKGGGFRYAHGTSFATPVAVAMGALILTFINQDACEDDREDFAASQQEVSLDDLGKPWNMARILSEVSYSIDIKYSSISPELLWEGFEGDGGLQSREHAWKIIKNSLKPLLLRKPRHHRKALSQ
ncbi:hypothetical protein GQ44DRAFT_733414 [Phaeosphaeriaceae sp. PMI808]|nr:hypothetical protein GQ44DRAFT_733414 [Phaeosphaeriaceae sp. PMI808]